MPPSDLRPYCPNASARGAGTQARGVRWMQARLATPMVVGPRSSSRRRTKSLSDTRMSRPVALTSKGTTMTRRTSKYILSALALPLVALAVVGCGGGNSSTSATAGGNATVNVAKTDLGNVLVDAQGRTLYLFKKD